MTHGSLFSGIGGFDLAAQWVGWTNVLNCEIDQFCQKVLKYHFPNSQQYADITKTDFTKYKGSIDVVSGGFPCQPFSVAGKRKGASDDRFLWHEMLRAIREIEPSWVIAENVRGLISQDGGLVFGQVLSDLEDAGYEVQPFVIPAVAVGAPHRIDRIWIVATKNSDTNGRYNIDWEKESDTWKLWNIGAGNSERLRPNDEKIGAASNRANARTENLQQAGENAICKLAIASDTKITGRKARQTGQKKEQFRRGNERVELSNHWGNFPTVSPFCGGNNGLSIELDGITFSKWRRESIKAYGNAIVPKVAYQIFKTINQIETL